MHKKSCKAAFNPAGIDSFTVILRVLVYCVILGSCLFCCSKEKQKESGDKSVSSLEVKYGDSVPLFEAKDMFGNNLEMNSLRGKTILLEFVNSEAFYKNPDFWKYSNVLAKRYEDRRFVSIIVLNDNKFKLSKLKKVLAESNVELPIFLVPSEKMNDLFGVELGQVASILIDPTSKVRFVNPILLPNDTKRQLVEKLVLGSVEYTFQREDSERCPLKANGKMPDLNLEEIRTGKRVMLSQLYQNRIVCFLFTAGCGRCEIKNFLDMIRKIEKSLKDEVSLKNTLIIFGEGIDNNELEKLLGDYKIDISAYRTPDLQNLTSEYVTRKTESLRPKVIFLDRAGNIRYLRNLSDFETELFDGSVNFKNFEK